MASHSGFGETTVRDYAKIAGYKWACDLLKAKALGRVKLGKLVDACNNNSRKLEALSNASPRSSNRLRPTPRRSRPGSRATRSGTSTPSSPTGPTSPSTSATSRGTPGFRPLKEDPVPVEVRDGKRFLKVEGGGGKAASPFVGSSKDWEREVAIDDFAGRKLDDILTEDFEEIRNRWDEIGGYLDAIIQRRRQAEAREDNPLPASGRVQARPSEAPPTEQVPQAKVGRRAEGKAK